MFDLSDRLRKALRHAGLSTDEMAGYLDVGRSSVSNWIAGRNRPNAPTLREWAAHCGVRPEWLIGTAASTDEPVSADLNGEAAPA